MSRLRRALFITLLVLLSGPVLGAAAQDQGAAVITSPLDGALVAGVVPVSGTASHPLFGRFALAFAYDPNPTDTWFSIQEPSINPVTNDVLGRWDTTGIADGTYVLRLRVYWSETDYLETFVRRVEVRNEAPGATPPAGEESPLLAASPAPGGATPPAPEADAEPIIVLPPTATPRSTPESGGTTTGGSRPGLISAALLRRSFLNGAALTALGFGLLGAYTAWRQYRRTHPRR